MAFLLCLLGAKRLLTVDDTREKKRSKAEDRTARLRVEGLPLGAVLQELDFNPLKSISTVEKRDPRRKKEKVLEDKGERRKSAEGRCERKPFAPGHSRPRYCLAD